LLFAVQALHACSFTLTHLGTMHYIQQNVSASLRNTAQGVYSALSGGLVMSIATVISGPLYRDFGAGAYLVMAGFSLAALGFAYMLFRLSPKDRASAGTS
jgi:PPP family 3-phenylpropionic acid transporter